MSKPAAEALQNCAARSAGELPQSARDVPLKVESDHGLLCCTLFAVLCSAVLFWAVLHALRFALAISAPSSNDSWS